MIIIVYVLQDRECVHHTAEENRFVKHTAKKGSPFTFLPETPINTGTARVNPASWGFTSLHQGSPYGVLLVSGSAFIPCNCFQMFLHLHHNFKNQSYDSSRRTLREGIEFLLDLFKPSSQGAAETISDRTAHQSPHNAKLVVWKRILSV